MSRSAHLYSACINSRPLKRADETITFIALGLEIITSVCHSRDATTARGGTRNKNDIDDCV